MYPILFRFGSFFQSTYGVLVTLAFLTAVWMVGRLSRKAGLNHDTVLNLAIYVALAALAGAKVLMILLDLPYYTRNPGEIFSMATLKAGGIFYGGLIAALVTAVVYMRKKRLPGLVTADVFAPAIAIGHAVGRLGCFAAGCCYGLPTHLPWAVTFTNPESNQMFGTPLNVAVHPTQLYESFGEAIIFVVLYRRFSKPHRPGSIIGLYLVLYSTLRFLVEFVRAHDEANPFYGPLVAEQWIALGLAVLGIYLIKRQARTREPAPAGKAKALPR